jgi:hypothetical protein
VAVQALGQAGEAGEVEDVGGGRGDERLDAAPIERLAQSFSLMRVQGRSSSSSKEFIP